MELGAFKIDNIKAIMIFLVVLGHFIARLESNLYASELVKLIYLIHMPVFVVITGYLFNKSTRKNLINNINTSLIPYLVFQCIYIVFKYFTIDINQSRQFILELLTPGSVHWFLLCLFFWRLVTPKIHYTRLNLILILLLPMIIGYFDQFGNFLALARLVNFYPYFFIGYHFLDLDISNLLKHKKRVIIICFIFIIILFLVYKNLTLAHLTLNIGYKSLELNDLNGFIIRFFQYIISAILSFSIILLIPNKKYFFTYLGRRTLSIYLLHNYFIYIVVYLIKKEGVLLFFVLAIITTILLGSNLSSKYMTKFIELFYIPRIITNKINLLFVNNGSDS